MSEKITVADDIKVRRAGVRPRSKSEVGCLFIKKDQTFVFTKIIPYICNVITPAYYIPNQIDLRGRLPEDLPNKLTISDILLELEDTGHFNIRWVDLSWISEPSWRAEGKQYFQWVQKGEVVVNKAVFDEPLLSNQFTMSTVRIKETRYKVFRYPIRLNIEYRGGQHQPFRQVYELSKETYNRLLEYIKSDVIQSQFLSTNFQIDFMMSECEVIS